MSIVPVRTCRCICHTIGGRCGVVPCCEEAGQKWPEWVEHMTAQIARVDGIYRCTALGETKFCSAGQTLPPCSCRDGGIWELLKADNMAAKDAIIVFVGQGILHAIATDELPEVGAFLNVRAPEGFGIKTGKHRIAHVNEDFRWQGQTYFHIRVERVDDLADDLPIHRAAMINP